MVKIKIVVILGQTSSGKSDLAVKLARKINGEVISADSRQVYKGLDIGTGKITKSEMRGVPHHLLDVTSTKKVFTVAEYQKKTIYAMADIIRRGKVPILCGGTGFYIDAITTGLVLPEVPPNQKLRKKLDLKSTTILFQYLQKIDPKRARSIDPNNKVRIIRAIEIAKHLGKVPPIKTTPPPYEFIKIGLHLPGNKLKNKINTRLEKRLKAGMLNEARKLHSNSLSWKRMNELGLEYRYMALHLQKKITKEEMVSALQNKIYQYAKRQVTWFKRDKKINWFTSAPSALASFPKLWAKETR